MTRIVYGHRVGVWVAERVHGSYWAETSQAIGLEKDGELRAGVVYSDWNGKSICCHMAATGRLSREYLWCVFDYPFRQCGCSKIIASVYSTNHRMGRMALKMGFTVEGMITDAAPDGDIVILTMTPDKCRFLEARYHESTKNTARA